MLAKLLRPSHYLANEFIPYYIKHAAHVKQTGPSESLSSCDSHFQISHALIGTRRQALRNTGSQNKTSAGQRRLSRGAELQRVPDVTFWGENATSAGHRVFSGESPGRAKVRLRLIKRSPVARSYLASKAKQ